MLRTLKRVGLATNALVLVYCSIAGSIVEYVSPVWAAIPLYMDELIESVQRKALKIIFSRVDYTEALVLVGLESLSDRRVGACKRFMATARQMPPLKKGINRLIGNEPKFNKITQLDTWDTVSTDPIEISNTWHTFLQNRTFLSL